MSQPIKGRGTTSSIPNRFSAYERETVDDGWYQENESGPKTSVRHEEAKSAITSNQSPDVPFQQSINPYRGCEHGCIYCFARPSHAFLDLSPGLDFETKLTAKTNIAAVLTQQLQAKNYQCKAINLGANTDPYQPIDRQYQLTRQIIEVFVRHQHPCTIITKSALVERDIDLLSQLAQKQLVQVSISLTTLMPELSRKLEPRASSPKRRLETITRLSEAGIPVNVLLAPVIPVLTDSEMETIMAAIKQAGAQSVDYILIRLPREVAPLFKEWLACHYPDMAEHIMNRIHDIRQGKDYDANFQQRLHGQGIFSQLIKKRFSNALREYQLQRHLPPPTTALFEPYPEQLRLF
jgi:DNA repair photolyase